MLGDWIWGFGSQAIPMTSCHDQMHLWFLLSLAWNHSSLFSWQHCPLPCSSSLHPDHFLLKLPFKLHFTGWRTSVYMSPRSRAWSCNSAMLGWGRLCPGFHSQPLDQASQPKVAGYKDVDSLRPREIVSYSLSRNSVAFIINSTAA